MMDYNHDIRNRMFFLAILLAICWVHRGDAVIGVPFGNVKGAEKLEEAGQFAKALEARELAAEFCEYFSIPEFEDDLNFFRKRGHLKQVEYTEAMLKQFRQWAKVSREKQTEDLAQVNLTPSEMLRYRQRIRRQLIGAADFYPEIHNSQLGIQISVLERDGVTASDFEKAAEGRERTARLYEKVSIPYVLHAIEAAKADGDTKEVESLEAKLAEYRAKAAENYQKAEAAHDKAATLKTRNQPTTLYTLLDQPDMEVRRSAIEAAEALGLLDVLRAGLSNDQPDIRMRAFEGVERHLDIQGLLHAKASTDTAIADGAAKTLERDDLLFRSVLVEGLIDALNDAEVMIRAAAYRELLTNIDEPFGWNPEDASETRQTGVKQWRAWLTDQFKPGLLGIYYQGSDFKTQTVWRIDSQIDFHWEESPHPDVPKGHYSICWVGKLDAPESKKYQFFTYSDDGVRLWIDHRKVIEDWSEHPPAPQEGIIHLDAGRHDLRMEFFNGAKDATIQLFWATDDMPQTIIPPERLWHFDSAELSPSILD